ncbi:hypothetical protein [Streptomyces tailanensis]|uniref:hypothetical protein n=1 Tax=Streptomyces tailanensis TaxID=2569858 RepID=UPI00155A2B84|nr:hypothetical protein [Streptomyces tailanensis]
MPADEVTHGTSVGESRARSGPRHAAPKKPLLTRLKMPAGKAIALAAMPTAVLMGTGFTPTLARAEDPASQSLTADEYKDCVEALEAAEDGDDATASPTPSPSASESDDTADDDTATDDDTPTDSDTGSDDSASDDTSSDDSSSSDSGSDDTETGDTGESTTEDTAGKEASGATASPSPSATETGGNVLDDIGSALEDLFTPDDKETSPSATPSATPSPSATDDTSGSSGDGDTDSSDSSKDAKDTADDAADKVEDTAKDVTDTAEDTTDDTADDTADDETVSPSPSPSDGVNAEDCPAATDDESGVEQGIPPLPDDPWYLNASSLLLKGASYKGVVKVKTADGSVKEVLKYVVSDGSDIGDLHQTVEDKQAGVTYHVQAGKGTTSTIRDGKTVMYTESISGNLLGLIPVTFDPKHPPPLDIPLIYFTNVKVVQAGQFGGTLTVPGMHQFMTD